MVTRLLVLLRELPYFARGFPFEYYARHSFGDQPKGFWPSPTYWQKVPIEELVQFSKVIAHHPPCQQVHILNLDLFFNNHDGHHFITLSTKL